MDEVRFQRLEDKVDVLKDDVSEIKTDMKIHIAKVGEHITGDKKIINEISPIMKELPVLIEMAKEYRFEKELKKKQIAKVKSYSLRLGVIAVILGIAKSIQQLFV